jgi:molybdate transport system substrate-binding protein
MLRLRRAWLALLVLTASLSQNAGATGTAAKFPPWSTRDSNALGFTVPCIDNVPDLHGSTSDPDLVVFAAGNQFMVMPDLMRAFRARHPEIKRIFYETLPPGIEARQIARGSLEIGNLIVDVRPDVYLSGLRRMKTERASGVIGEMTAYASNTLAIEVRAGNPKHITSLLDLGRSDVRVSMPNPAWEGVALQIQASYRKAGGTALERTIMHDKVARGTTILTHIHHRETAINIITGKADAGPVWLSEALYQRRIGNPIEFVTIPAADNAVALYVVAALRHAPHPAAARDFARFVTGPQAAAIYRSFGFTPPAKGAP